MITPNSFLDLDNSVLRISSIILKVLNNKKIMTYDEILKYLLKKEGENILLVLLNALSFLYILGTIEYHLKTDSFERLK